MPLTKNLRYVKEPTSLQCGQAVLAMLADKTVDEVVLLVGTERETTLSDMFKALEAYDIAFSRERIAVSKKEDLPDVCILSLETPRCWHWSLYYKGTFYDPEHGVLQDFPESQRRYYWEIYD